MDKKVSVQLNGNRKVTGTLKGYDIFLNVTLIDALEEQKDEKLNIGTIVCINGRRVFFPGVVQM
jgi:small nuclear ribonucleoprotein G